MAPAGEDPAPQDSGEDRLAKFYNRRAVLHPEHPLTPQRAEQRELFIARLKAEGRHGVLEIGTGPGLDGLKFVQAGIQYTGVDLSEEQVRIATAKGLNVSVASARNLPFADGAFPALWSMSTLLHIPNRDIDGVVRELVRVAAPGAPIAVGLWSGEDEEVLNPEDQIGRGDFSAVEVTPRCGRSSAVTARLRNSSRGRKALAPSPAPAPATGRSITSS